jgi:hypothetical protein
MILLSLWDNIQVKVAGLKFKPDTRNSWNFDFIIIIKISTQIVKKISIILEKIKNNLIYAETVHVL